MRRARSAAIEPAICRAAQGRRPAVDQEDSRVGSPATSVWLSPNRCAASSRRGSDQRQTHVPSLEGCRTEGPTKTPENPGHGRCEERLPRCASRLYSRRVDMGFRPIIDGRRTQDSLFEHRRRTHAALLEHQVRSQHNKRRRDRYIGGTVLDAWRTEADSLRKRPRVHIACDQGLIGQVRRRRALHRTWLAVAERLVRKLQQQASR